MVTTKEISNTVVTAKRKIIQRKVDRLVFNVENSSKASAGDALDILSVTPGVQVQNNKIRIIGKNSLKVLINDKAVLLSDEELSNFLKSMASENIKNIEVITTPPAKYKAAGNSGLINITLKEVKKDSWNAQVKSSFTKQTYSTGSLGGSFNSNKEELSIASSLNYSAGSYYGGDKNAVDLYEEIKSRPYSLKGHHFSGFLDSNGRSSNHLEAYLPKLGKLNDMERVMNEYKIEEVIIAVETSEHNKLKSILDALFDYSDQILISK